ncbi:uncharacterized protein RCC_08794 [Ramularia collo-cygni]|uniref:F-box domain-containing protein n=1 Tax=Ramularia collo-cygni TaxID=112498 RepID=A0A2D3VKW2_9PEZI|nr:uncharacterized protein RCC_08794 [Ramularia collo-cygni]CZT23084.1 uncharacterized protein RCC_08794 [Ramularia collo-cygni]
MSFAVTPLIEAATTPSHPSPPALEVPEILENILQYLPQLDIITSKRVCKFFNNLIKNSIKLDRKLFLVPVTWEGPVPQPCDPSHEIQVLEQDKPFVELNNFMIPRDKSQDRSPSSHLPTFKLDVIVNINARIVRESSEISTMVMTRPIIPFEMALWDFTTARCRCLWYTFISDGGEALNFGELVKLQGKGIEQVRKDFPGEYKFEGPVMPENVLWLGVMGRQYRYKVNGQEWLWTDCLSLKGEMMDANEDMVSTQNTGKHSFFMRLDVHSSERYTHPSVQGCRS